ncbi:Uncharacterized protein Rs2_15738 [Raphanus sativus]|nr:Uncharacterized protein Rs2_15738 [Raphanus sativus]
MEDILELQEFLELKDGEQLGDLDSSREVTIEDLLDQNSEQKLDDNHHTSGKDLETSPKLASIDTHPTSSTKNTHLMPSDIYRRASIDTHLMTSIDTHLMISINIHS